MTEFHGKSAVSVEKNYHISPSKGVNIIETEPNHDTFVPATK